MGYDRALFQYLLRLGDNTLILGQRVSEWCGHAPALEEDIAMANVALDLIGQTQAWLGLAGEVEGEGRSADDLAFLRDAWDFRNLLLVERPNIDFAHTITRQFLFDAWNVVLLGALTQSADERISAIAQKSVKEATYHLDRSAGILVALGDGTDESHARMQDALDILWPFTGEMFVADAIDDEISTAGIGPDPEDLRDAWETKVTQKIAEATLTIPDGDFAHVGGKNSQRHSEHLGHLLSSMQWLQRSYPGATW
jgi:ring-1,2-phenylacetyl-CoA epoxidase subunit PaaC